MKKILTYFFVTLGVIFFVLICGVAYVWFADPFNIRPLIDTITADAPAETGNNTSEDSVDKNPALSPTQEQALESIGIDPASLPSEITPEMESCFVEKLGSARVAEIKEGDSPTPIEVVKTKSCY